MAIAISVLHSVYASNNLNLGISLSMLTNMHAIICIYKYRLVHDAHVVWWLSA